MNIIRIALARPLTFVVMAILIVIFGMISALTTPVDIFPKIRMPVIAIAWQYTGLPPAEMEGRVVTPYERALTTVVNDMDHMESQSLQGMGIVKVFLQPGADVAIATAQVTSVSQTMLRTMPSGMQPPLILNYDASTVPILQLALSGNGLGESQIFDLAFNQVRPALVNIPGIAIPLPYGGKQRQIQIDIDPVSLQSKGLTAQSISTAISAQTQITPVGSAKIGPFQYAVHLNNAPGSVDQLNALPVAVANGATIYMRDVAHVRDGSAPQTNVVHVDGGRSILMTILKNGSASTLSIIQGVKDVLPIIQRTLPDTLKIHPIGDQSIFVKSAIEGVVHEGLIAAGLTSLMILLFLGSWRMTIIIATSIPLSVLAAISALSHTGNTLNIMTLGGLSLAVGLLVDEGTVTVENISRHIEQGEPISQAIMEGAQEIVTPAFVSLLCICTVFLPMFFLPGVSGFLFVPLALAVVFSMVASFVLSRTLVPTMAMYMLKPHAEGAASSTLGKPFLRLQRAFEQQFERLRSAYGKYLEKALLQPKRFVGLFLGLTAVSFLLIPFLGRNFFPTVDAGTISLHVRGPIGYRIEETSAQFDRITQTLREIIPADEIVSIVDNIGMPSSIINNVYSISGGIGSQDGDFFIQLAKGHKPTAQYIKKLRERLPATFPGTQFSLLPSDITSQILNFGAPAPLDIQVQSANPKTSEMVAQQILREISLVPGVADARIQQSSRYPQIDIDVDRARIAQLGLTEQNVTTSLANSLAGTMQTSPVYYLNPENGVSYQVVAQVPEYRISSLGELSNIPVGSANNTQQLLAGVGSISRGYTSALVSHFNIRPVIDVFANTNNRDLGGVSGDINKVLATIQAKAPKGTTITLRGQYRTMNIAFSGLLLGLLAAAVLIYLLLVVNFQSWLDPFVIITALPSALAGIVWILFVTGTRVSVPALIGTIMCLGVATANSILVISFARERLHAIGEAKTAALEAGTVRFRPVIMTALAMIIGMLPMALGLSEGGEQNAPLGRAVIGGLSAATFATLMVVPVIFSLVHRRPAPVDQASLDAIAENTND